MIPKDLLGLMDDYSPRSGQFYFDEYGARICWFNGKHRIKWCELDPFHTGLSTNLMYYHGYLFKKVKNNKLLVLKLCAWVQIEDYKLDFLSPLQILMEYDCYTVKVGKSLLVNEHEYHKLRLIGPEDQITTLPPKKNYDYGHTWRVWQNKIYYFSGTFNEYFDLKTKTWFDFANSSSKADGFQISTIIVIKDVFYAFNILKTEFVTYNPRSNLWSTTPKKMPKLQK